jgi:hypothetical protein
MNTDFQVEDKTQRRIERGVSQSSNFVLCVSPHSMRLCVDLVGHPYRGRDESRRDSVIQPRVARNELPWVCDVMEFNPEGVASVCARQRHNPVGVENNFGRLPRVVRCAANPGLNDSIPLGLSHGRPVCAFPKPAFFETHRRDARVTTAALQSSFVNRKS